MTTTRSKALRKSWKRSNTPLTRWITNNYNYTMKVEFNTAGRFVLTAENEHDNNVLFVIVNSQTLQGVNFHYAKGEVKKSTEPKVVKLKKPEHKVFYRKVCKVEGCGDTIKNQSIHNRYMHGICSDGHLNEVYTHNKTKRAVKVKKPVAKLSDGTYRVRPGLLD